MCDPVLSVDTVCDIICFVCRPCEMFHNPLELRSVKVAPAIQIDANHMVVVYRRVKDNSVERQVVMGPSLFMPTADEWYVSHLVSCSLSHCKR